MFTNIVGFVKGVLPSFSRSDIEADMDISLDNIPLIIESYTNLADILKVAPPTHADNKNTIKAFYKEANTIKHKIRLTPTNNIALDTIALFNNIKVNGDFILNEISDAFSDTIVSQALTVYKANILRVVPHFYYMTKYATDFLNFYYANEVENTKSDIGREGKLNAKQKEHIIKNMWVYTRLVMLYGEDHATFKMKLDKLGTINLPKEKAEEIAATNNLDSIDLFNNLPVGFIGSPIYSIRMIFAQMEADRYKSLKDKRRLLELRYLHLKLMKERGETDPAMEKEIEYLQKRISDIDYSLAKIEADIEG